MSDEYRNERVFTFVDWLENGEGLYRTEYGSLATETMLKEHVLRQFSLAQRHGTKYDKHRLSITMEVSKMEDETEA